MKKRGPVYALPRRLREVLIALAEGKSSAETAAALGIAVKTVDSHRSTLRRRLKIQSMAGLVRYAVEAGCRLRVAP